MPYQGDRQQGGVGPPKFTTDLSYVRKMPGVFIVIQLACTFLAFVLALAGTMMWGVRHGHGFFTFITFVSALSGVVWLVVKVLRLDSLIKRDINWNIAGIVFNAVNAVFVMIASCFMIEIASAARPLRAAGVFGFLGFTGFLAGLVWEVLAWYNSRDDLLPFATASVVRGRDRPDSPESGGGEVDLRGEIAGDTVEDTEVGFVGMKARPVSSFLQPSVNGGMCTPMLLAPGNQDARDDDAPLNLAAGSNRSSASSSSVQGEWQTPTA